MYIIRIVITPKGAISFGRNLYKGANSFGQWRPLISTKSCECTTDVTVNMVATSAIDHT
jgi:hypothetical protein